MIDTPPLGSVIDSAIIAEECDGAMIVIESGVISYRFAQEVKQQLEKSNCPILGVVLNKSRYVQNRATTVNIMANTMENMENTASMDMKIKQRKAWKKK